MCEFLSERISYTDKYIAIYYQSELQRIVTIWDTTQQAFIVHSYVKLSRMGEVVWYTNVAELEIVSKFYADMYTALSKTYETEKHGRAISFREPLSAATSASAEFVTETDTSDTSNASGPQTNAKYSQAYMANGVPYHIHRGVDGGNGNQSVIIGGSGQNDNIGNIHGTVCEDPIEH